MQKRTIMVNGDEKSYTVTTENEILEKISDAPIDDTEYARKNGEWTNISGGGGGGMFYIDVVSLEDKEDNPHKFDVTMSCTMDEIIEAYNSGKNILVRWTPAPGTSPSYLYGLSHIMLQEKIKILEFTLQNTIYSGMSTPTIKRFDWTYVSYAPEPYRNTITATEIETLITFYIRNYKPSCDYDVETVSNWIELSRLPIRAIVYNYDVHDEYGEPIIYYGEASLSGKAVYIHDIDKKLIIGEPGGYPWRKLSWD